MAAKGPDNIERDYSEAIERAKRWADTDPEKERQLTRDADQARASEYRAYAEEQASAARSATLENAKNALRTKYPRADINAISGSTPDELEASAKASHDFVETQVKAAEEATRGARRAESRGAWTGNSGATRVGLPGGETIAQPPVSQQEAEAAYGRTAEVIGNARLPGHQRRYSEANTQAVPSAADPEMAAWQDYKTLHRNSGLSFEAFRARNAGQATFVETKSGVDEAEDKRG